MEMAGHGLISRQLPEGIAVGKFLYSFHHSAILFGAEYQKEIKPLFRIWRGIEPRYVSPVPQQIVSDAHAVFRDHVPVVAADPGVFEVVGIVQRIEVLVGRGEYGHRSEEHTSELKSRPHLV